METWPPPSAGHAPGSASLNGLPVSNSLTAMHAGFNDLQARQSPVGTPTTWIDVGRRWLRDTTHHQLRHSVHQLGEQLVAEPAAEEQWPAASGE